MGSFGYDLKAEMRVWLVEFQGLGGFRLRWACRMEFYECGAVSELFIDDILVFSSLCFRFLLKTPCKVECTLFSPYYQCFPPFFCLSGIQAVQVRAPSTTTLKGNHPVLKDC